MCVCVCVCVCVVCLHELVHERDVHHMLVLTYMSKCLYICERMHLQAASQKDCIETDATSHKIFL